MELTSLDLSVLEHEFKELEDGHVQKVYQRDDELTLEVYVPGDGKKRLILGPSYAFLSKYKRDNPTKPPAFAMELRKHLGRIDSIEQKGFDRVLEIESGDTKLVAEIFGRGNFILVRDGDIISAFRQEEWADRAVLVGEEYQYPEPATDPRGLDDFFDAMEDGEIVRRLASDLSLGGTYAEEVCARSGIDKNTAIEQLSEEDRDAVREELEALFDQADEPKPELYLEDGMTRRAAPFELETYSGYEKEDMETFSRAIDEYFYRREQKEEKRKRQEAYQERKQGLERQKEQQERKLEGLKTSSVENREKAELIYTNYQKLEEVQEAVHKGVEEVGWKETRDRIMDSDNELAEDINSINERDEFVSVDVDGKSIKLTLEDDLEAIASRYYDKAKESESKMESVREALAETEKELEELEEEDIDVEEVMEDKSGGREKEWFEKYRWFYSSGGFLVLAGRDAQTNEMLAKKHMEPNDLYFHADFDGAPSVVVKDGQDAGEETLREAAQAAVTFSKTWKAGIGADDVYYVTPEQVTKNPESGEYLEKGAFVIRGDREYMRNVSVEAAIGPYEIEGDVFVPMCGPSAAVDENCMGSVELKPGRTKKSELAKEIRKRFDEYDLDLDYIIRALPPGKSDLAS
ncbi:MAG: ribosome rescue protein RqcH [Candidatus Nanohaloarchaea archaeon]